MDPITIITAISAGLNLVEQLLPLLRDLTQAGAITAAEQAALLERYQKLRDQTAAAFSGPEWQRTTAP